MTQFVKVGKNTINLDYVKRIEDKDGSLYVHVDGEPPLVVKDNNDVAAVLAAVDPKPAQTGLKEKIPVK